MSDMCCCNINLIFITYNFLHLVPRGREFDDRVEAAGRDAALLLQIGKLVSSGSLGLSHPVVAPARPDLHVADTQRGQRGEREEDQEEDGHLQVHCCCCRGRFKERNKRRFSPSKASCFQCRILHVIYIEAPFYFLLLFIGSIAIHLQQGLLLFSFSVCHVQTMKQTSLQATIGIETLIQRTGEITFRLRLLFV